MFIITSRILSSNCYTLDIQPAIIICVYNGKKNKIPAAHNQRLCITGIITLVQPYTRYGRGLRRLMRREMNEKMNNTKNTTKSILAMPAVSADKP